MTAALIVALDVAALIYVSCDLLDELRRRR